MTETQVCNARILAADILKAWRSQNLDLLCQRLTSASEEAEATAAADAGESERLEMLGTIAKAMRLLVESDRCEKAALYLPLLRHLAYPPHSIFEFAFRC